MKTQATQCKKSLLRICLQREVVLNKLWVNFIISRRAANSMLQNSGLVFSEPIYYWCMALFSSARIYWSNSMGGRVAPNSQPICLLWGWNTLKHVFRSAFLWILSFNSTAQQFDCAVATLELAKMFHRKAFKKTLKLWKPLRLFMLRVSNLRNEI